MNKKSMFFLILRIALCIGLVVFAIVYIVYAQIEAASAVSLSPSLLLKMFF